LLTAVDADLSSLPFAEAAEIWMDIRRQRPLRPRTHESTRGYLDALVAFFCELRLNQINPGHLREYQIARKANRIRIGDPDEIVGYRDIRPWKRCAGASIINHELNTLSQLLSHCRLWAGLKPFYHPLSTPSWSPRDVLSDEDEERLFDIASRNSEVSLAYCVAAITNNTSAAGCELRGLKLKHLLLRDPQLDRHGVDLNPSEIYIPPEATKNNSRPRKIPLNPTAKWAVRELYKRALALGATQPEHYLFPFRIAPGKYDPMRPPSRWFLRNNWNKLRELTGLSKLCPHDLRHQCITRLFENGATKETVKAIAGHVTDQMADYYSHIRVQAKMAALNAIDPRSYRVAKPVGNIRTGTDRIKWSA
jgi:integrase